MGADQTSGGVRERDISVTSFARHVRPCSEQAASSVQSASVSAGPPPSGVVALAGPPGGYFPGKTSA